MKTARRRMVERIAAEVMPRPKKPCGGCTLCCKTIAVAELNLPSFTRCPHERNFPMAGPPGCAIYDKRPASCRVWSCQWAIEGWDDELRPDRCGVVIDPLPDLIRLVDPDTGEKREVPAVQMWATSGYELAYRKQPVLAAVLASIEQTGMVIWRYRDEAGVQQGIGLLRGPDGKLGATAPAGIHAGFSGEMSVGERLLRAQRLLPPDQRLGVMDVPRREYSGYLDKAAWGDGPWQTEPDKRQWLDPVSGFACLIQRNEYLGNLCGYVGVPPTHAAYGLHYNGITKPEAEAWEKEFREDTRAWAKAGYPDLMSWWRDHPGTERPGPVPGIGERLYAVRVHGGLTYCGGNAEIDNSRDEWERWRQQKLSLEAQVMVYPRGDAAQFLKRWGPSWDDYEAWIERIKATTICCVDSADEIIDVWWFGFDCGHAGDMSPRLAAITRAIPMPEWARVSYLRDPDLYRDFAYVEAECEALANQLADMHVE
jgi:hypothetical protein